MYFINLDYWRVMLVIFKMKCQNKDKTTNQYCKGKAKPGVIINRLKVCEICFYWIKRKKKEY